MSQLVVTLIVIMLPGIIAAIVSDKITFHEKWDSFRFGLYSLVLGVLSYGGLQAGWLFIDILRAWGVPAQWTWLGIWQAALKAETSVNAIEVFGAAVLALPIALFASFCINHKLFNKLARFFGVSTKYGDENLFSYFMGGKDITWIYVRDKPDDLTYEGHVISYAENSSCHEVVLAEVKVYRYSDSEFLYEVPFVYLCKPFGSIVIESIPKSQWSNIP
ncbi:hypothetical protein SAMN04490185_3248 [Pseudomonas frederiksbergensis]|uniref:Uncharacterized protein n=1 Tax=Pseudomonas frederiksbergensis TaxID=104087 RepID=A0A1H4ZP61_9PSED|nr:hypothetical protein [Pseudomonas frederiksbergensis]SED31899.1 hypothetical protein SAMN04490185_3248 [Pseudomonas frederiksbergensis]